MVTSRVPCPQCGALNFVQDPQCLGCGIRFTRQMPLPAAPPAVRAAPLYAPDEMCMRCFSVLLPAAHFDTSNTLGGTSDGVQMQFGGGMMGGPQMAARELSGVLWLMDFIANLLVGSIIKKNFDKRLKAVLAEAPNSLCCPSCRTIVRRQ